MTRWVVVDGETGKAPAGLRGRTSWPTERLARAAAGPGEVARRMTVAGPAGPFADVLRATIVSALALGHLGCACPEPRHPPRACIDDVFGPLDPGDECAEPAPSLSAASSPRCTRR